MASVLVTGAAGFIGFHVSMALLRQGHRVVGVDSFTPYYDVTLKRARVAELRQQPGFTLAEQDICAYEELLRLVTTHRIERICHLAAQAGVRYSIEHPFAYQKSNLEGFLAVLEACRHGGVARLVYASSSSVYGGSKVLPFSEADRADTPVSLYAATKRANELMAHAYTHLYGLQTVGLRFFTVYGPWGRPDMAMWLFAEAMLAGRPLAVFNGGDMQRDFTYIDDIVQGVMASLFRAELSPWEVINLGNNSPEDLREVIRRIAEHLGVTPKLELKPLQPGDVRATYADIRLAQEKLGFAPTTPISQGIPRFLDWFRAYRKV